jgi:hypothetical protein
VCCVAGKGDGAGGKIGNDLDSAERCPVDQLQPWDTSHAGPILPKQRAPLEVVCKPASCDIADGACHGLRHTVMSGIAPAAKGCSQPKRPVGDARMSRSVDAPARAAFGLI